MNTLLIESIADWEKAAQAGCDQQVCMVVSSQLILVRELLEATCLKRTEELRGKRSVRVNRLRHPPPAVSRKRAGSGSRFGGKSPWEVTQRW